MEEELGADSVTAAGSGRWSGGRGGRAGGGCGADQGLRAARGRPGAVQPGRRGAVASCGRGLARRFRPPRRGVLTPALARWARRGLCAGASLRWVRRLPGVQWGTANRSGRGREFRCQGWRRVTFLEGPGQEEGATWDCTGRGRLIMGIGLGGKEEEFKKMLLEPLLRVSSFSPLWKWLLPETLIFVPFSF